jgi:outer membrane lipoprotein-sorting protein
MSHDADLVSEIRILERDAKGLPIELELAAPVAGAAVEVELRDVSYDVAFDASVFVLEPPRSIVPEYLGAQ